MRINQMALRTIAAAVSLLSFFASFGPAQAGDPLPTPAVAYWIPFRTRTVGGVTPLSIKGWAERATMLDGNSRALLQDVLDRDAGSKSAVITPRVPLIPKGYRLLSATGVVFDYAHTRLCIEGDGGVGDIYVDQEGVVLRDGCLYKINHGDFHRLSDWVGTLDAQRRRHLAETLSAIDRLK